MSGVWFGDIGVAWLTEKETSLGKDTVEKNFVGSAPQVYELNSNLENGSYSVVFNEEFHPRNETLLEQIDGVRSMPLRHPTEFPFQKGGDEGHIVPENISVSRTPSQTIDVGEISLRFMEDGDYQGCIEATSEPISSDFSPTPDESVIAIPNEVDGLQFDGSSKTKEYSMNTVDGTVDLYTYQDTKITYDLPSSNYTLPERNSPVRSFDGERSSTGNYGTDYGDDYSGLGEASKVRRVYSDLFAFDGKAIIDNGKILAFPTNDGWCEIYKYDSGWKLISKVRLQANTSGYLKQPGNYESIVDFPDDYTIQMHRGLPVGLFTFDGESKFVYETEFSLSSGSDNSHYYTATDGDGNEVIVIRTSSEGFFEQNTFNSVETIEWKGLDSDKEYEAFAGFVPSNTNASDFARWVYNIGNIRRTLIQR